MVAFSSLAKDKIEEIKGSKGFSDKGLLRQFLESKERQQEGKLLKEAEGCRRAESRIMRI